MKVSVKEFENKVYLLEGVRIVLRLNSRVKVPDYDFERAVKGDMTVRDWKNSRVIKCLGKDIKFTILDPTRFAPRMRITMEQLRNSYPS